MQDLSYKHRLEIVQKLGKQFPGFIAPLEDKDKSVGLFAGIYLQTKWQMDSGRDKLPIWFWVNYMLTIAPYAYSLEFLKNPGQTYEKSAYVKSHPTRNAGPAPISQTDTCRAWKEYFQAASTGQNLRNSQFLWHAHVISIKFALWQYANKFESSKISKEELGFWQGWIRFILSLEKLSPPTNELFLRPLLKIAMPVRSPLGGNNYAIASQNLVRRTFLKWISRKYLPQSQFLRVFT